MYRTYPTIEQVEVAGLTDLVGWHRHLPSPSSDQVPILTRIIERRNELMAADPTAATAASKAVGWH
jgi:hypothetical protein